MVNRLKERREHVWSVRCLIWPRMNLEEPEAGAISDVSEPLVIAGKYDRARTDSFVKHVFAKDQAKNGDYLKVARWNDNLVIHQEVTRKARPVVCARKHVVRDMMQVLENRPDPEIGR